MAFVSVALRRLYGPGGALGRAGRNGHWRAFAAVLAFAAFALTGQADAAPPVKAEVSVTVGEFARIIIRFSEDVETDVRNANGIVIVSFKTPVALSIDRLSTAASGYVAAARRDPDGRGVRIALARKVTVNSITAGERLYIDLMPDTWSGAPPSLPQDVIEDLGRRAREAEKKVRREMQLAQQRRMPVTRVRVSNQPTFSRYVFDLPDVIPVSSSREKDSLTLTFDAPLKFDLADVKGSPPPMVAGIDTEIRDQTTTVRFGFIGNVDVRAFREDTSYVVDVGFVENKRRSDSDALLRIPELMPPVAGEARGRRPAADAPAQPSGPSAGQSRLSPPVVSPPASRPAATTSAEAMPPVRAGAAAPAPAPASASAAPAAAPGAAQAPVPGPTRPIASAAAPAAKPAATPALPPASASPSVPAASAGSSGNAGATAPAATAKPVVASSNPPVPPVDPSSVPVPPPPRGNAGLDVAAAYTKAGLPATAEAEAAATEAAPSASRAKHHNSGHERVAAAAAAPEPAAKPGSSHAGSERSGLPVELNRHGENLVVTFPFVTATPTALFQRADALWAVFDGPQKLDLSSLLDDKTGTIKSAKLVPLASGVAVRLKLERPRLASLRLEGPAVAIVVGDSLADAPRSLAVVRNPIKAARLTAAVPFDDPRTVHRVVDPEAGDTLTVVTALGPARGFLKGQEYVEFNVLPSAHGVVIEPLADDLQVELTADKIELGRPGGLSMSATDMGGRGSGLFRPAVFDPHLWGFDREADFEDRRRTLINAVADAAESKRTPARLDLARFYLARGMYPEAKGVLDVALAEERPTQEDPAGLIMRAFANIMLDRVPDALKDLTNPLVAGLPDTRAWRGLAAAREGNWADANEKFRNVEATVARLPIQLQRLMLKEAVRASIEVQDFATAANELHGFETLGVDKELEPVVAVLAGQIAEGLGRSGDALGDYRLAVTSANAPAAAQARLRETVLRYHLGDLKRSEVISDLEELTTRWRGDETEIEALQLLSRLYMQESRYRDAFHVMRTALMAHPNSELTRRIQEEAAATFDSLFLAGKGDAMPAIDALGLFYDFRELTPIGRRGDEMIRRLADRLISVDLLDQAAELLQHQVDHRLQGAARSQVATRLAIVYLMNHKPDRALTTLRSTQISNLPSELRNPRLMIEARALSDIGRADLALEVIANLDGREAVRLRSDILWNAKRWQQAAEQIEMMYGERWRDWQPLTESERADLMRAAIGYTLAGDELSLGRFRDRYVAKMADGPDRRAFEVATAPRASNAPEFANIARIVGSADTLDGFLRDLRARYPETGSFSTDPTPPGTQSRILATDMDPTASIRSRNIVRLR